MKFGDNLKYLRKMKKISQEKLAEKLGVSRQSVSKWETGEAYPEMKHILKICELFHCKINDLVHENFSDFSTLDQDVQDSVVKFKKDKQQKMQLLSKIMQVIAKMWKYLSIGSFLIYVVLFFQAPSLLKDSTSIEEFLSELSVLSEYNWLITLSISNLLIFIEIILGYGAVVCVLNYILANSLDKLCKSFYVNKTPFMSENTKQIKRIGYFFIVIRFLNIVFNSILKSIATQKVSITFNVMDIALVLIVILGIYIFEYGYEIQLDSKGVIFDEEEIENNGSTIGYLNKNFKKIVTRILFGVTIAGVLFIGFTFSKVIYDSIMNFDPSTRIQADAIITMEELGYKETDIFSSGISNENGIDYYSIDMDSTTKMIYDEEYMSLRIVVERNKDSKKALESMLSTMTTNKRYSIYNACNKQNPCTFDDTKYITSNNIHEYMIELDKEKWNVDYGYVLYNKDNYRDGSGESNEYFLVKDNTFIYLRLYTPLEFNDEQIKVLSTLFERSEEIFEK